MDAGTFGAATTFTGVAPGPHNVTVRSTTDNTCVSAPTALTVNDAPTPPAAPTASVTAQPTCALNSGTITITAPLGAFEYSLDGGAYGAATTFTGVAAGPHNVTVRPTADNTCVSAPTALTVNDAPTPPAAPTASVTVQPTCGTPTGTIVITAPTGAFEYRLDAGTFGAATTFTGVAPGPHNVTVRSTTDNTCVSAPTALTVNDAPTPPAAPTASVTVQPTCGTPTGTIVITAPTGAFEYQLDAGTFGAATTFTGVAPGPHNVTVRSTTDNTCVSAPTALTVNDAPTPPAAPTASVTVQPTCGTPTGTIVITAPTGAFEYRLDAGTFGAATTFTGVAPGPHNVTVRSTTDNTCVSAPTALTVNDAPTPPAAPTASVTAQPTCALNSGTITITAPLGAFEYSLDGGAYGAATTFTGVAAGPHNVTVRSTTDNTCVSAPTALTVNDAPTPPAAPTASVTAQPTCALNSGTITITAPLGAFEYSLDGGAYGAATTFTGVAAGPHNVTVRPTADNTCVSAPTALTVNDAPTPPAAPTASVTVQPTCGTPTGTIVITAPTGSI